VSIAEFPSSADPMLDPGSGWAPHYGGDGGGGYGGGGDRTPPQDNNAEQSVLGSMLLSKDAIADVVEAVRGTDFYRPAHESIFDVVVDLYGRGEPADPVTVSAELDRRGDLARIGGAPYLHTLSASVPIAANAGYYAEIVREKAILRRLVDVGTRIAQMGYSGEGQVDDVVDRAQAEVYAVTDQRTSEDYAPLSDIMESALDEIEAISNRDGEMVGVPTGFADLDELTNGLHGGQMVIVAARPAVGKALALDTPLPTPTGWTTMGDVVVGDLLLSPDGHPTTVVAATEVMPDRPCYEIAFSDGSRVVADAQHQWLTENRNRPASVVTSAEIAGTALLGPEQRTDHAVSNASAIKSNGAPLPLPPYVLGSWLAAACSAGAGFTSENPEISMFLAGEAPGDLTALLRSLDVFNNKHIPAAYLRASETDRRSMLAGLMDADGTVVGSTGSVQIAIANERLANDVHEVVVSLGYTCSHRTEFVGMGGAGSTCHWLTFSTCDDVFRVHRKAVLHKELRPAATARVARRWITEARRVDSVPVRCVEVDSPDHMYLAGRSMIPTHNSTIGLDICRSASIQHNMASVIFSLEMTRNEITMRLLSAEAKIPLNHMRNGHMNDEDWAKLARRMGEVSSAPFFIDDSPNMTMMEIRAKARRLKQRHDLRLIVIDYLQLMSSGKKVESRQVEVSEFSRQIKLLAKELDVPIVALSQLNRGPEQRSDKRPLMSDLRESGCLTADTRLMRADNNAEITIGELIGSGARDIPVWSLDDRLKLVPRTMTHAFSSGVKEVYELTLASGRRIKATGNHPFLTCDGWVPLRELSAGARIGSVRHVPAPMKIAPRSEEEIALLAQLIGGGCFGTRSDEAWVPGWVFGLPKEQVALFLRGLWAAGGSVHPVGERGPGSVTYASTSGRLLDDVARLLLRFNVFARLRTRVKPGCPDGHMLHVSGHENQLRFLEDIGVEGDCGELAKLLARSRAARTSADLDTIPTQVWDRVRHLLTETDVSHREFAGATGPARQRLGRVAEVLGDAHLDVMATNDVFWDSVASVRSLGDQEVYDATVLGTHNFVVEGIAAHNSIEQDADMVVLLHREDVYEKESARPGEADLIVAKHRNGPTRDVVVAFQGHYSRFVDMAHG